MKNYKTANFFGFFIFFFIEIQELSGANIVKIKKEIFESALEGLDKKLILIILILFFFKLKGLSKGYMDYAIDPILPIVNESIKNNVAKVTTLSPKEYSIYAIYIFIKNELI